MSFLALGCGSIGLAAWLTLFTAYSSGKYFLGFDSFELGVLVASTCVVLAFTGLYAVGALQVLADWPGPRGRVSRAIWFGWFLMLPCSVLALGLALRSHDLYSLALEQLALMAIPGIAGMLSARLALLLFVRHVYLTRRQLRREVRWLIAMVVVSLPLALVPYLPLPAAQRPPLVLSPRFACPHPEPFPHAPDFFITPAQWEDLFAAFPPRVEIANREVGFSRYHVEGIRLQHNYLQWHAPASRTGQHGAFRGEGIDMRVERYGWLAPGPLTDVPRGMDGMAHWDGTAADASTEKAVPLRHQAYQMYRFFLAFDPGDRPAIKHVYLYQPPHGVFARLQPFETSLDDLPARIEVDLPWIPLLDLPVELHLIFHWPQTFSLPLERGANVRADLASSMVLDVLPGRRRVYRFDGWTWDRGTHHGFYDAVEELAFPFALDGGAPKEGFTALLHFPFRHVQTFTMRLPDGVTRTVTSNESDGRTRLLHLLDIERPDGIRLEYVGSPRELTVRIPLPDFQGLPKANRGVVDPLDATLTYVKLDATYDFFAFQWDVFGGNMEEWREGQFRRLHPHFPEEPLRDIRVDDLLDHYWHGRWRQVGDATVEVALEPRSWLQDLLKATFTR